MVSAKERDLNIEKGTLTVALHKAILLTNSHMVTSQESEAETRITASTSSNIVMAVKTNGYSALFDCNLLRKSLF